MIPDVGRITAEPSRFYDGGAPPPGPGQPDEPPDPETPLHIVLVRHEHGRDEDWQLRRRIAYCDRHCGELVVGEGIGDFHTDLTSVPVLFTWLVPKSGRHLPAALLHDGLVHEEGNQTYRSTEQVTVRRSGADRIMRDAMADSGTRIVRRWLIWAAVTTATMITGSGTGWSWPRRAWHPVAVVGSLLAIAYLGLCASFDLLDIRVPGFLELWWMGEERLWVELTRGLAAAILIPLALSLLWAPHVRAGAIAGIALATLFHVTIAVAVVSAAYWVLELVGRSRLALGAVLLAIPVLSAVVLLLAWL
ncbi:hypothetical protein BH18ACT7_BH18ACT7_04930 [soil metagenome]